MFPPVHPDGLPYLVQFSFGPGLAGFAPVISPVTEAHVRLVQTGLDAFLGGAAKMMIISPSGDGQPESGAAGTAEKLVVLVTAQFWVVVKKTDGVKNPPMNHEKRTGSHVAGGWPAP